MKIFIAALLFLLLLPNVNAEARDRKARLQRDAKPVTEIVAGYSDIFAQILKRAEKEIQIKKDAELLAEVIYHENWHTDSEHLAAYYTGAVVMNRVRSDKYPDSIHGVLYERGQYCTTKKFYTETIPAECYQMAEDIIRNGTPDVPTNVVYQAMFKQGTGTWKKVKTDYFCFG